MEEGIKTQSTASGFNALSAARYHVAKYVCSAGAPRRGAGARPRALFTFTDYTKGRFAIPRTLVACAPHGLRCTRRQEEEFNESYGFYAGNFRRF